MTAERCEARRDELVSILEEEGLGGLIVTHLPNIRYLTGFSGSSAVLVVSKCGSLIVTDPRYRTQVALEVGDAIRVEVVSSDVWGRLWESLSDWDELETLGFESHSVSARKVTEFAESPFADRTRPADSLVERLRVSKCPEEVKAIEAAAHLATEALDRALLHVKPGLTEL